MELSKTDKILLHLSLIQGVGPAMVERLLAYLTYDQFDQLYRATNHDFMRWGIAERSAKAIVVGLSDMKALEAELLRIEKYKITFVTAFSDAYPSLLKHTHRPPLGLYVRGELAHNYACSLAIVGSRQANSYGQQLVDQIVPGLVEENWLIVSGGALGVDSLAHAATLRAGGKTMAIIGSGLLNAYPATNRRLFDQIVEKGGAVVSPFPLLMEGFPGNFPARNRIIAGMTRGTLVVQAAAKSGALITADFALKEGREVFAIPGSVFDPLSAGSHHLLQQGAHLVQAAEDILQVYGFAAQKTPIRTPEGQLGIQRSLFEEQHAEEKPTSGAVARPKKELPPFLLFCSEPRSFDELLAFERCTQTELYDKIWEYQVAGLLDEVSSGKWQAGRA